MKKHVHALILAAITIVYAIAAFSNLGDLHAPQTFIKTTTNEQIIFDLGEQRDITRINYFAGIGECEFTYEVSRDGIRWYDVKDFYSENGDIEGRSPSKNEYSNHFTWHISRVDEYARFVRVTPLNTGAMLNEFAFYNNEELLPIFGCTAAELADEQTYAAHSNTYMNSMYFDEVYHGRTGYEILNKIGIYETTHPPLGKVFISWGIWLFGMVPFGWRFMGTLAGVLMVPAIYLLANKLLNNKTISLVAAGLLALDFMHFSLSRIATIDSYPVLFLILTFYFLACYIRRTQSIEYDWKKRAFPLIGAGIAWGLACASKWIGLYAAPGILVILLFTWRREYKLSSDIDKPRVINEIWKHFLICIATFIVIPAIIYFMAYIPQLQFDRHHGQSSLDYVVEYQSFMYKYHAELDATHPFASSATTWPINYKPLWAYMNGESHAHGMVGSIVIMGNPAIWWVGLIAMIAMIGWAIYSRRFVPVFLACALFTNYLNWLLVPRIAFIYHYFACVPIIILAICYWAAFTWDKTKIITKTKKQKAEVNYWTRKVPAWAWSAIFGLSSVLAIFLYGIRNKMVAAAKEAQKFAGVKDPSGITAENTLVAILAFTLVGIIWYFTHIVNAHRAKPEDLKVVETKRVPGWAWIPMVAVAFVLFVWFYPILAGNEISFEYAQTLKWFKPWVLFWGR